MKKSKRKASFKFKLILLAFFLVYIGVSAFTQQMNIYEQETRKGELAQQYAQAEAELFRLEAQSEYMDTKNYIENTAREKLGMVYEDEIIIEPQQ